MRLLLCMFIFICTVKVAAPHIFKFPYLLIGSDKLICLIYFPWFTITKSKTINCMQDTKLVMIFIQYKSFFLTWFNVGKLNGRIGFTVFNQQNARFIKCRCSWALNAQKQNWASRPFTLNLTIQYLQYTNNHRNLVTPDGHSLSFVYNTNDR